MRKYVLLVIFMMFLSRIAFAQNANDFPAKRDPAINLNAERERKEILPKLRDRRCTTMSLDQCNCPDAKEMKAYIDALIESGITKDDIFYKVAKRFSLNTILDEQIKAQVEKRLIQEAGGKRPQISLEANSLTLGQVSKKEKEIKKRLKIYNNGAAKLIISNIKVSCSCVTASLEVAGNKSPYFGTQGNTSGWEGIIEPKETAELEIVLDLTHSSINIGKLVREIYITSNDPIYPETSIRMEAEIKE